MSFTYRRGINQKFWLLLCLAGSVPSPWVDGVGVLPLPVPPPRRSKCLIWVSDQERTRGTTTSTYRYERVLKWCLDHCTPTHRIPCIRAFSSWHYQDRSTPFLVGMSEHSHHGKRSGASADFCCFQTFSSIIYETKALTKETYNACHLLL
jgi:hypothetical protein